jgi:hypothetical protein
MLGFLSCAWAGATALKSAAVAISSDKPLWIMLNEVRIGFIFVGSIQFCGCLGDGFISKREFE